MKLGLQLPEGRLGQELPTRRPEAAGAGDEALPAKLGSQLPEGRLGQELPTRRR